MSPTLTTLRRTLEVCQHQFLVRRPRRITCRQYWIHARGDSDRWLVAPFCRIRCRLRRPGHHYGYLATYCLSLVRAFPTLRLPFYLSWTPSSNRHKLRVSITVTLYSFTISIHPSRPASSGPLAWRASLASSSPTCPITSPSAVITPPGSSHTEVGKISGERSIPSI